MNMAVGGSAQLRRLECELSLLKRADGSARVIQGGSSVVCAVYGPAEVKIAKEQCDRQVHLKLCMMCSTKVMYSFYRATLDVVIKPESGLSSPKERQLEEFICSCCRNVVLTELHPHTAISIVLQVENSAGAVSEWMNSSEDELRFIWIPNVRYAVETDIRVFVLCSDVYDVNVLKTFIRLITTI